MMRSKVNKSAAVRELLSANPDMPAAAAVAKLAERHIHVGANLVYAIRAELRTAANGQHASPSFAKLANGQRLAAPLSPTTPAPALPMPPRNAAMVAADGSVAGTIKRVIALANEVGGYAQLGDLATTLGAAASVK